MIVIKKHTSIYEENFSKVAKNLFLLLQISEIYALLKNLLTTSHKKFLIWYLYCKQKNELISFQNWLLKPRNIFLIGISKKEISFDFFLKLNCWNLATDLFPPWESLRKLYFPVVEDKTMRKFMALEMFYLPSNNLRFFIECNQDLHCYIYSMIFWEVL